MLKFLSRLKVAVVCLTLIFLPANFGWAQQDWPQFRGPHGNAAAPDQSPPTTWSDDENIVWKTKLAGRGSSSPIVVGDKIFLTEYTGFGMDDDDPGDRADLQLNTTCFDRQSGEQLWSKPIQASDDEQEFTKRVRDHGYASGTPASDGSHVFAYFGVSGCVCYDLDGNEIWHNDQLGKKTAGFGSASSPVVFEDLVYINASIEGGALFALDKSNGEVVWKRDKVVKSWSTPCVAQTKTGETELIINQKETVYGLNPQTGEQLWSCNGIPDYVVPVPVSRDGIIYCLGGRSNRAMSIRLGGRGDVSETHKIWDTNVGANVTSPVLVGDHLYWASDKGIANCLDAKTGESVFRERMPTRARIYASIVRGGQHLYLTTRDSGVLVLKAEPKFEEVALNKIGSDSGMFNASPAVHNGQLLFRTDTYLYCIGEENTESTK